MRMKSGAKLWVKRLSGLSIILILVFVGTYGESSDKIVQIMNVEENNLLELESGEEGAIQLEKIRFYTVVTLEGNEIEEYEVKLIDQDGLEISGYEPSSIEKINKRPDSNGKLVFIPIIIFEVPNDAEYIFHNQGNNTLWVLDDIEIQSSLISEQIILISMFSCCLGFPLGVIALIGWLVVWRRKDKLPQKLIVSEQIMTTDQLFKQYNATLEKSMIENDDVPAPFAEIERVKKTINELSPDDDERDDTREKVEKNLEEQVDSEEYGGAKESDGQWKNWDDGE